MFFDWYQASIPEDPADLIGYLQHDLKAGHEVGKPRFGYATGVTFRRAGSVIAEAFYGGSNAQPHVLGTSDAAPAIAAAVRGRWPVHRVSRLDASEDFDEGPGTFDRLWRLAHEVAKPKGVRCRQDGDWMDDVLVGRTFYAGAASSVACLRVYEKGKEMQAKGIPGAEHVSRDLVRVELQVRPPSRAKAAAAAWSPEDAFGVARWTRLFAERLWSLDVARVHVNLPSESDDERALRYLTRQYAGVIGRLIEQSSEDEVREDLWVRFMREVARKAVA